jgi:cytoskeletal protein RodZ
MKMVESQTFGAVLKTARQRSGLSLQEIADMTNVASELWRDLERDDLAFWPDHLVASTCLRRYASAVGLDGDAVVDEFTRAFPPQPDRVSRLLRANPALVHEIE